MDVVKRFVGNAAASGSEIVELKTIDDCFKGVLEVLSEEKAKHVAVHPSPATESLFNMLRDVGYNVLSLGDDAKFLDRVEVGVNMADLGIAETGTVVIATASESIRLISALPLANIILLHKLNIIDNITDVYSRVRGFIRDGYAVSFVTGPSKTGDIELQMVKGVHGPHRVVIFLYGS